MPPRTAATQQDTFLASMIPLSVTCDKTIAIVQYHCRLKRRVGIKSWFPLNPCQLRIEVLIVNSNIECTVSSIPLGIGTRYCTLAVFGLVHRICEQKFTAPRGAVHAAHYYNVNGLTVLACMKGTVFDGAIALFLRRTLGCRRLNIKPKLSHGPHFVNQSSDFCRPRLL